MTYCVQCVLPDTRPNLELDENGVCNACRNHLQRPEIDWQARQRDFLYVVENAKERSQGYDCLIPVSGGKDSTWQVIKCLEYGLKPLCLTWKTPARTAIGQKNLDNLVALGVDHIDYQISPDVERRLVLRTFEKFGSTAIPMHMAIHAIPLKMATRFDIPLIIWGENSAVEYGTKDAARMGFRLDENWVKTFGVTHGTTATDWVSRELSKKDLTPYFGLGVDEAAKQNVLAIFLGHYFSWDPDETFRVARDHGFQVAPEGARTGLYDFADIDDDFISIHHWMKWYKFGFTRLWDNLSLEIRNGRLSRAEAIGVIATRGDETPVEDIAKLCSFLEISEGRFFEIAESYRNGDIWKSHNGSWMIENFLIEDWKWS